MQPHSRRAFLATSAVLSAAALAGSARPGRPDLSSAVESGDLERVRALLDADPALVRARDASGRSAFLVASLAGHDPIAKLLLERGHEPDLAECAIVPDF